MKLKSPVEVSVTGEKFVLALYGGQRLAMLDEYMYSAYNRNIAIKSIGATFTLAQQLDSILCGHIYKYHNGHSPTEWGWKYHNNSLTPIATDLPAASQKLMKVISCNCKKDASANKRGANINKRPPGLIAPPFTIGFLTTENLPKVKLGQVEAGSNIAQNHSPTVQITFIFIDFRVCDFAFGFKTQNAPCVSRFKRVLFSDRFQFAF